MRRDDELERFKSDINLVEYAESRGYLIDSKESSKASTVMRKGGDKIVVATDEDGHGIYFSIRDFMDNGSIIDFVQKRDGLNLGQVRRELRPWAGTVSSYRPALVAARPKPVPSTGDRQRVLAVWMKMAPAAGTHAYLEKVRGIDPEILADDRFAGMIRKDGKGNAVFPHYDQDGISGYELKNVGFTGFATGGIKAVWHSSNVDHAEHVVIVESAIDALSHAQLVGGNAAYISTGGSVSDHQLATVRALLESAANRGAAIILATDNDEAGLDLANKVQALIPAGAQVFHQVPQIGKDWNDQLLHLKRLGISTGTAEKPAYGVPP